MTFESTRYEEMRKQMTPEEKEAQRRRRNKYLSVFGLRRYQNAAKQLGYEIYEQRDLERAYGQNYFYRTTDKYVLVTPGQRQKLLALVEAKERKASTPLTEEQKQEKWARRLANLTGISLEEAKHIAGEKIAYKRRQIDMMEGRESMWGHSVRRQKVIDKVERDNPLRRIEGEDHAQAILEASHRHRDTDYEERLKEGHELADCGLIEHEEVRESARLDAR
jgi:hypothetical protein